MINPPKILLTIIAIPIALCWIVSLAFMVGIVAFGVSLIGVAAAVALYGPLHVFGAIILIVVGDLIGAMLAEVAIGGEDGPDFVMRTAAIEMIGLLIVAGSYSYYAGL